jgi:hypothetical protein
LDDCCGIIFMIVYGVISYILILAMIVGYFLVKKWGDGKEQPYDQFKDEISPNNKGETTP